MMIILMDDDDDDGDADDDDDDEHGTAKTRLSELQAWETRIKTNKQKQNALRNEPSPQDTRAGQKPKRRKPQEETAQAGLATFAS